MNGAGSATPRMTVVITTYNRPEYLQLAVASVLAQSLRDFRLVVLDDGSVTDTREALRRFEDPRILLVENESNLGVTQTMRRGFSLVETEYFVLFADDDLLEPRFLEACVEALDLSPDAIAAATRSRLVDDAGTRVGVPEGSDLPLSQHVLDAAAFARMYFSRQPAARLYIAAMVFRTALLRAHGLRYPDEGFARCSDDLFLAAMAVTGRPVALVPDRLYLRRFHQSMNSSASPGVVTELLRAAAFGHAMLKHDAPVVADQYARFVIQSALQATRDMSYPAAADSTQRVRAALGQMGLSIDWALRGWGWKRRVEFSSPLGLWLVRVTQPLRLRQSRRAE